MLARWLVLLLLVSLWPTPALATVNDVLARNQYVGNASTTVFPYTFKIFIKDEIEVLKDGVVQNLDTDYSVGGVGNSAGGTITFANPPAAGVAVTILRLQPDSQLSVYLPNEAFPATRLEKDLDKNIMVDQEQEEKLRRAPKFFKQSLFNNINIVDPVNGLCLAWEATATPTKIVNVPCGSGGGGGGSAISLNSQTWAAFPDQFFGNDANVTISSSVGIHTLGWTGCLPVSRGGIGACSGTQNAIPYFDTPTSLSASILSQTDTNEITIGTGSILNQRIKADGSLSLTVSTDPEVTITTSLVALGANGAASTELVFFGSTSGYAGFFAPAVVTTPYHCKWPANPGTSGYVLSSDGASPVCTMSWIPATGTGTTTGTGVATRVAVWDATSNLAGYSNFLWIDADTLLNAGAGNTIAGASNATVLGDSNTVDGSFVYIHGTGNDLTDASDAGAWGENNTISTFDAYAVGENNELSEANTIGMGFSNTLAAPNSGAFGYTNNITGGGDNWAFGTNNTITGGSTSGAYGSTNDVSGGNAWAYGDTNTVTHDNAIVVGLNVASVTDNSVSLGVSASPQLTITNVGGTAPTVHLGVTGQPVVSLRFAGSTSGSTSLAAAAAPTPTTFVLPTADGAAGTCISTDGAGNLGWANCSSGGTGLTSLGGQTGATQTFAKVNDTNVTLTIGSATDIHTFTMGWTGTLANTRGGTGQNSSAWSALPLVTAGTWSQYAGTGACTAGSAITALSASGVATCTAFSGTGTVTHTAGALTLNQVVVGNGGADVRTFGGADTGVFFASASGALSQDTSVFSWDYTKNTLKLGFGGDFATEPWLSPPLFASPSAEIGFATGATGPKLTLTSTNGTIITPTASVVNNLLGTVEFKGFDGTNGVQGARMYTTVQGAVTAGVIPTNISFETTDTGGVKHTPLVLRNNGNINLGGKIIAYGGLGAANGALLIGNGAGGRWDASTLTAGPGVSITNGPGTIQISTTASQCVGGGRVTLTDTENQAVVTFATPMANADYAMSAINVPGPGAIVGIPVSILDVTVNGFTVVLSAAPGTGFSTSVAWIATPSTCTF